MTTRRVRAAWALLCDAFHRCAPSREWFDFLANAILTRVAAVVCARLHMRGHHHRQPIRALAARRAGNARSRACSEQHSDSKRQIVGWSKAERGAPQLCNTMRDGCGRHHVAPLSQMTARPTRGARSTAADQRVVRSIQMSITRVLALATASAMIPSASLSAGAELSRYRGFQFE
jgi:hypothetical protein